MSEPEPAQQNWDSGIEAILAWTRRTLDGTARVAQQVAQQTQQLCCGCHCARRRPPKRANFRRNSVDIFFDMYDDDEAFGHDEMERLLTTDTSAAGAGSGLLSGDAYADADADGDTPYGTATGNSTERRQMRLLVPQESPSLLKSATESFRGFAGAVGRLFGGGRIRLPTGLPTGGAEGPLGSSTERERSGTTSSGSTRWSGGLLTDDYSSAELQDAQLVSDDLSAVLGLDGGSESDPGMGTEEEDEEEFSEFMDAGVQYNRQ